MNTDQSPLDILLVEDNPGDARLVWEILAEEPGAEGFALTHAGRLEDTMSLLKKKPFSAVLLDLSLPGAHSLGALEKLNGGASHVPVVVLTGVDDEADALDAMRRGAQDYLVKGKFDGQALARALRYAMERHRVQRELSAAREKLEKINADLVRANRFKADFLANVSHDLRSPLASTSEFIAIVLDGIAGDLTGEQREYLSIARENIRHVTRLIDDLLDASRVEAKKILLKYQTCNLSNLLYHAAAQWSLKANGMGIRLMVETENPDLDVYADPEKVSEAVANLVENAMKFTPRGGQITLSARAFPADPVLREIVVADTGIGMAPEAAEHIFERFRQANNAPLAGQEAHPGLGLGLFVAREIVEAHQGKVWAESEPGKGTEIHITLPRFDYFLVKTVEQAFLRLNSSSCSLLTWKIAPSKGRDAASLEGRLHETRRVLEKCLRSADLVFPPLYSPDGGEVWLIAMVSAAEAHAADGILNRIRAEAARARTLARDVLDLETLPCGVYPFPPGLCYPNEVLRKIRDITHLTKEE